MLHNPGKTNVICHVELKLEKYGTEPLARKLESLGRILNCLCVDGGGSGNAKKQSGTTSRQEPTACDAPDGKL